MLADEKKWRKSVYSLQKFNENRGKQEADGLRAITGQLRKRNKEIEEQLEIYMKLNEIRGKGL